MGDPTLEERLRADAEAFNGLLSLIPAGTYYGNDVDTSEQWKQRKQTKSEKRAARLALVDPENHRNKTVKQVMDERAVKKRKVDKMQGDEEAHQDIAIDGIEKELPGQGLKKRKLSPALDASTDTMAEGATGQEKILLKIRKRLGKGATKKKTRNPSEAAPAEEAEGGNQGLEPGPVAEKRHNKPRRAVETVSEGLDLAPSEGIAADQLHEVSGDEEQDQMEPSGFAGLEPDEEAPGSPSSSTSESQPHSPTFDASHPPKHTSTSIESTSTTTSVSSTIPPSEKPKHIKIPTDTTAFRARLAAKIDAFRAARNADGPGKSARTRQELIEERRKKQAERKAHKKELRQAAKAEEDRKREETLASARNSPGSMLSPLVSLGTDDDGSANHFAFGRMAFADGTQLSHDLSYVKDARKKRGPAHNDYKAQLAKLEAQKQRVAGLDEDKRKEVLEKETWLAARRRVDGQKVHDDESLLKKAVKRKEKTKQKSARQWKERTQAVDKSMKERQKKREANIRQRKEEKMAGKGGKKAPKKKGRAGFEGGGRNRR